MFGPQFNGCTDCLIYYTGVVAMLSILGCAIRFENFQGKLDTEDHWCPVKS